MASPLAPVSAAQAAALPPAAGAVPPHIKAVSRQFEQVFLSNVLGEMFAGIQGDGPLGTAGPGAEIWRSMLTDQFAKGIASQGGIGLSDQVARELVRLQELST
jgi:Rod binding domain-containing protein